MFAGRARRSIVVRSGRRLLRGATLVVAVVVVLSLSLVEISPVAAAPSTSHPSPGSRQRSVPVSDAVQGKAPSPPSMPVVTSVSDTALPAAA